MKLNTSLASGRDDLDVGGSLFKSSLSKALHEPVNEILQAPRKRLRASLIDCLLSSFSETLADDQLFIKDTLSEIIEHLHAASIIIDDIEDGSLERRGKPTLHVSLGLPLAVNAGCWLLFTPFEKIRSLHLAPKLAVEVIYALQETIVFAHEGQAVDLATDATQIPTDKLFDLWMQTARRKTGALISLAARLPFLINGDSKKIDEAGKFGRDFGIALQMFDDISDFFMTSKISDDLKNRRLNWGIVCAAQTLNENDFKKLNFQLKHIEDRKPQFNEFIEKNNLKNLAKNEAISFLNSAFNRLKNSNLISEQRSWDELLTLKDKLIHAYD